MSDGDGMDSWILAHGSGVDDVLVLAFSGALVVSIRLLVARHRDPEDEPAQTEGGDETGP
jgi:hypothetical protein